MNLEDYRNFCLSLAATSESTPFDENTLVFKVLDKMFVLTNLHTFASVNLKCDPEKAIELREKYDFILPGYHMSKKHWNTVQNPAYVDEHLLKEMTLESYRLVVSKMPKKDQSLLGM